MSQGVILTWKHEIKIYRAVSSSNTTRKHREQSEACQSAKESEDLCCQLPNFGKQFFGEWLAGTAHIPKVLGINVTLVNWNVVLITIITSQLLKE